LELADLFDVCGKQETYSMEDAKRLHRQQWTADEYTAALDTNVGDELRISRIRMLEILQLRSKYIAERGATLNNPHVTKTHLHAFAGTSRVVSGPNWAAGIRQIAIEFVRANPGHPAAKVRPAAPAA
jgi:hypothetical protein